uniref:Uncharacterized protein n=1 Tax=Cacopsylla melanoneura TaxID=428564 RepID=A0A8D8WWL7_9HEMI
MVSTDRPLKAGCKSRTFKHSCPLGIVRLFRCPLNSLNIIFLSGVLHVTLLLHNLFLDFIGVRIRGTDSILSSELPSLSIGQMNSSPLLSSSVGKMSLAFFSVFVFYFSLSNYV